MKRYFNIMLTTLTLILLLSGCQSAYYGAMEKVGIHKRDIMVDRVTDARDSQQEAKQEFSSALAQFQSLLGAADTDLQIKYDELNAAYEDSKSAAEEVSDRIEAVESVSEALFEEWEEELDLYSSEKLRRDSASKLSATKRKYKQLINSMKSAEERMDPVLAALQDQVLYLKHNLNARAIDGLKGELKSVENNVARLIRDMEKSIAESEAFIAQLKQG
jgi:Skp family chaperone for outer membrane proteins